MTIQNQKAGDLFGQILPAGDYQASLYAQVNTTLDPSLSSLMLSTNIPTAENGNVGQNWTRTNVPAVDAALTTVDTGLDDAARPPPARRLTICWPRPRSPCHWIRCPTSGSTGRRSRVTSASTPSLVHGGTWRRGRWLADSQPQPCNDGARAARGPIVRTSGPGREGAGGRTSRADLHSSPRALLDPRPAGGVVHRLLGRPPHLRPDGASTATPAMRHGSSPRSATSSGSIARSSCSGGPGSRTSSGVTGVSARAPTATSSR